MTNYEKALLKMYPRFFKTRGGHLLQEILPEEWGVFKNYSGLPGFEPEFFGGNYSDTYLDISINRTRVLVGQASGEFCQGGSFGKEFDIVEEISFYQPVARCMLAPHF